MNDPVVDGPARHGEGVGVGEDADLRGGPGAERHSRRPGRAGPENGVVPGASEDAIASVDAAVAAAPLVPSPATAVPIWVKKAEVVIDAAFGTGGLALSVPAKT